MYMIRVGFATGAGIIEREFTCRGFNSDLDDDKILILDSEEDANVIGFIVKDKVLYLTIMREEQGEGIPRIEM